VLTEIPLLENWIKVPIALYVPDTGNISDLLKKIPLIRRFNIRVYIPHSIEHAFTKMKLLSSLGVHTAIILDKTEPDWDALSDLAAYSLLTRVPHATIYPFSYLSSKYNFSKPTDFNAVYFNDPRKYLHLTEEGAVALSTEDINSRCFISNNVCLAGNIHENTHYIEYLESWRHLFLDYSICAYCEGWRICLGKFIGVVSDYSKCQSFCSECLSMIEQDRTIKKLEVCAWQL